MLCGMRRHSTTFFACLLMLLAPARPAGAAEPPDIDACKARWQDEAAGRQLSARVREQLIPGLSLLPRVLELDRRQPEFTTSFGSYLEKRLSDTRIESGRQKLLEHAALLESLTRQYGVPGRYLVAFWGLETNFGGYLGNTATLDALATLACDERRSRYFTAELFEALALSETQSLDPATMRGSWAGAMGQTQFMPSNYRRYGRDGDGDGKVDLWNSVPDALHSAAHFLAELGWEPGLRWGREVLLPRDFDYAQTGLDQQRPLSEWSARGLRLANGGRLPAEQTIEAAVIVPAGHRGPAFIVYRNFRIIMRWNNSESYALSVGLLADRLIGAAPLHRPPPDDEARLSLDEIRRLQARLNALGYDTGTPDGIPGPATRKAIRAFQRDRGLIADGYHGPELRAAVFAAQ